ncbi:MAG: Flp family type IVb pilin [Citromicrobium sp.]|nr:MAG: Flp family type IVb pilin [Citromicrobium sp.]
MFAFLGKLGCDEGGATAVEYGLILALIFLATLAASDAVGREAISMWNEVSDAAVAAMGN